MNCSIYVRLTWIRNQMIRHRHFSCLSSQVNYHFGYKERKRPENNQSSHIYKIQTCYFSRESYARFFSPDNPPIGLMMELLQKVHDTTGLPWWGSILLTTFTLRTCITVPFAIFTHKNISRLELLFPQLMTMLHYVSREVAMGVKMYNWSPEFAKKMFNSTRRKKTRELYWHNYCHPYLNGCIVLIQIPLWISVSAALRNICGYSVGEQTRSVICQSLLTEGALWFTNLTVPDSTWILPLTLGLLNLAIIEINLQLKIKKTNRQKIIKYVARTLTIILVPIAAVVPSCMSYYWTISSFYGFLQSILLKLPKIRKLVGIPKTPSQSDTPFKDMLEDKKKLFTRKKY